MNNKHWFKVINDNRPELGAVLKPSWLSGLVALSVALVAVFGTVVTLHYKSSSFQILRDAQSDKSQVINDDYDALDDSFSKSQLISDIPLLILWGGVGLIAYSLTMKIYSSVSRAVEFEHELDYVHADRRILIKSALFRAAFRLLILLLWMIYINFTRHILLPYVIALTYTGSGLLNIGWALDTAYLLAAIALLALGLHLHAVLLRLVLLKTRVFGAV